LVVNERRHDDDTEAEEEDMAGRAKLALLWVEASCGYDISGERF
jgi:hypothetical protein